MFQTHTWHKPSPTLLPRTHFSQVSAWTQVVPSSLAGSHRWSLLSTCRTSRCWTEKRRSSLRPRWSLGRLGWLYSEGLGTGWGKIQQPRASSHLQLVTQKMLCWRSSCQTAEVVEASLNFDFDLSKVNSFYRVMLRRARLCHSMSSVCPSVRSFVCPSVRDVQVPWSHRLNYCENNFTAE